MRRCPSLSLPVAAPRALSRDEQRRLLRAAELTKAARAVSGLLQLAKVSAAAGRTGRLGPQLRMQRLLSRQTVGVYLRRWGWTAKKPQKRWAEQDADRVKAWVQDEDPKIKARAAKEGAIVLFCDEMGVRAGQTAGSSYAPVGQRAVVKLTGKRFGANVISAIGADGTLLFDVW